MNPLPSQVQHGSLADNIGALVVAAAEGVLLGNDFGQASCTEDTIAEDLSDASQNTHDGVPGTGVPTSIPQLSTLLIPNMSSEISSIMVQNTNTTTSGELENSQSANPPIRAEIESENRRKDPKKRSKNWTTLETLKLIRARAQMDERFRKSSRKGILWDEIAQFLQKDDVCRDGQQCKDKWEKLTAGYKEVREGTRDKEDLPFYEEIHQLLSSRHGGKASPLMEDANDANRFGKMHYANGYPVPGWKEVGTSYMVHDSVDVRDTMKEEPSCLRRRKRDSDFVPLADMSVVQELLETVLSSQERLFKDVLEAVEKKERIREQIRQEREEIWRAEERAQRFAFNNTMVLLTQRLLGDAPPVSGATTAVPAPPVLPNTVNSLNDLGSPKKRSKNWKRTEVMHLIRFRREMETKFAKSTRRAGLWEELGNKLASLGIKRDGKQCREKWDKLMAGYKDVIDGKKDKEESPYFGELLIYMEMAKEFNNCAHIEMPKEDV